MTVTVHNADCLEWLDGAPADLKTIFADPPDNLGLGYDGYRDRLPTKQYYNWLELVMAKSLRRCQVFWLSYYHEHDLEVSRILRGLLRDHPWSWQKLIWRFTFGQYTDTGIPSGYRPLLLLWSPAVNLHYDRIRVASERMRLGDQRASGLRIPDDVWEVPRVTGNSRERRAWHPTQHPEELMERILLLSGHPVADLFAGTGTTGRVAKRLGMECHLVEQSARYCERIRQDLSS